MNKNEKEQETLTNEEAIDNQEELKDDVNKDDIEEASQEGESSDLEAELAETKDKYLRLLAEFENYKKRTFREKLDTINSAARETMTAILPVLDDFDRAKMMADDESSEEMFSEGVTLVYQKLKSVLANKGLKAMESTGEIFDSEIHEAVTEIPAPSEDMKGKIIDTIEKGYTLNDKIIRHAKVVVGK